MNSKDMTTYQNAIQLARNGQTRKAYEQFCFLASNPANRQFPDLLLWIAETTPSYQEAQQAISEASNIAPYHPGLAQAQALLASRPQPTQYMHFMQQEGPYRCPFCGTSVQPIIENKISAVGWTIFFILLVLIITVEICWLGLFIRTNVVKCPMCNNNLKGYI